MKILAWRVRPISAVSNLGPSCGNDDAYHADFRISLAVQRVPPIADVPSRTSGGYVPLQTDAARGLATPRCSPLTC
jgi:hypothetical protein